MEKEKAKIKFELGQFKYEVEGPVDFVEKNKQDIPNLFDKMKESQMFVSNDTNNSENNIIQLKNPTKEEYVMDKSSNNDITLRGFINSKNFANQVQLFLGIAYYHNVYEKEEFFTSNDIKSLAAKAKVSTKMNFSDKLYKNAKKDYVCEAEGVKDGAKLYYITDKGINFVENYENKDNKKIKKVKSIKKKTQFVSHLNDIPLEELKLENYSGYKELKKTKDIIIFIMGLYNKHKQIEYFSVQDIQSVAKTKFGYNKSVEAIRNAISRMGADFDSRNGEKYTEYKMMTDAEKEFKNLVKNLSNKQKSIFEENS